MRIAIIGLWDIIATSVGEPPLEGHPGKTRFDRYK